MEHPKIPKVTNIGTRKADHIRINLEEDVQSRQTTGLEKYRFPHRALPELDLEDINLSQVVFGRQVKAPILISSMTGGTHEAAEINFILATAAQETGIAMGLGSQRVALENPKMAYSFQVRTIAPDILLLANIGAIQLNYGYDISHCQRAVDMVEADALILHFNALQEALQPEGDTCFAGLINKIELVCKSLSVPVIAKEVGWGFSSEDVRLLIDAGVSAIDVAGAGGTSWSQVEMHRTQDENQALIAKSFINWGIPTSESILNVKRINQHLPIIASGGLNSGLDIAKCIALGARLGGIAKAFLKTAVISTGATIQSIRRIEREIQICMFACGTKDITELQKLQLIEIR